MTARRIAIVAVAVVAACAVAAAVVLPRLVDPERYRDRIEQELTRATGWDADLGAIDLSLWGGIALTVAPASLAAEGDGSSVEIERIAVHAGLWPLLRGELDIDSIALERPTLRFVRPDADSGWSLPVLAAPARSSGRSGGGGGGGIAVSIGTVRVGDGSLTVVDRTTDPPLEVALTGVNGTFDPATGVIDAAGALAGGGSLAIEGNPVSAVQVRVDDVPTDLLHAVVGPDVLHPGGRLSGAATLTGLARLEGDLTAADLELLAGERPLPETTVKLAAAAGASGWTLDDLQVETGGVRIVGSGALTPALDVRFELGPAGLEDTLAVSRSVLPLDLDVTGPGEVHATLRMATEPDGVTALTAKGELSAARFRIAETLPAATDIRTGFELTRDGRLRIDILGGTVAGGPLRGTATLDSVDPLGTMTIDGTLADAALGGLVGPLLTDAADRLAGPTAVEADLRVDLGREFDLRALGGTLAIDSRDVRLPGWSLEKALGSAIEERGGVAGALARLRGDAAPADRPDDGERAIDGLDASIDFGTWPWTLRRLGLSAGDLDATGSGTFDAETGDVEVTLRAALTPERTAELVEKNPGLRHLVARDGRLTVPLTVSGPMTGPTVRAEIGDLLRDEIEQKKDEAVKGLLDRLLERKKKKEN